MLLTDARLGVAAPPTPRTLPSHLPTALHYATVELAPTDRFGSPLVGTTTAGCAWFDPAAARRAAVGEAAEWYCGSLIPDTLRYAAHSELDGPAVDPATLTLYREDQYAADGFPFVPFTRDLPVGWRRGVDLDTGAAVWVPASLVHLGYGSGPSGDVPLTNLPVNAGIAAGPDLGAACLAAQREVIERDALATAWLTGAELPRVAVPARWHGLLAGPDGVLRARLHRVPDRFGATVLLAVVDDRRTGVIGVGAAMRPDPREAALKAFAEAAMSVAVAADLTAEDSAVLARLQRPDGALLPWRADRGYRDAYRADLRDVIDITCHVQWYLDPRNQRRLHDRLDATDTHQVLDDLPVTADADRLRPAAGLSAVAVDLTTADVAAAGLRVARVTVPDTRSTTPAALSFLGGLADPVVTDPLPHA